MTVADREEAMSDYNIIWTNNTWNGEPTRDFVELKDGTVYYDYQAHAYAAVVRFFERRAADREEA